MFILEGKNRSHQIRRKKALIANTLNCCLILILLLSCQSSTVFPVKAVQAQQTTASPDSLRNCAGDNKQLRTKKKNPSSSGKDRQTAIPASQACIEVRSGSLAVQEYLQKFARDSRWTLNDEQATEDLWSFSMALSAEELTAYAKTFSDPKIGWSGGKATVNVRTTELADGFARIVIGAKFDGYGVPEDKFAPNRESWSLPSSGALEAKMAEAVKAHFKTGH